MAFRTQKISQMTPKGANLEATDLIEVSTIESGSYVTRSITGQEIIDAAVGNVDWGDIGGTLSAQTDLQFALDAKVPTSRTLTINGVTQDLSADRTFTISTGITIGSTAIASGTVGRILFEGAGNVVQESSSLFWDNTNARLGVGTSSPTNPLDIRNADATMDMLRIQCTSVNGYSSIGFFNNAGVQSGGFGYGNASANALPDVIYFYSINKNILFNTNGGSNERMRIAQSSGNVLINTTTDAGYKLDVNGTARATKVAIGAATSSPYQLNVWGGAIESYISLNNTNSGNASTDGFQIGLEPNGTDVYFLNRENGFIQFRTNNLDRLRIFSTGNIGINTTTDAGFRLDVNGTARVQGATTFNNSLTNTSGGFGHSSASPSNDAFFTLLSSNIRFYVSANGYCKTTTSIVADTNGVGSVNASAISQIDSTTKGFLPPRMTTTQKNAIASPAAGLMVYDTTLNVISYYNGSMWI